MPTLFLGVVPEASRRISDEDLAEMAAGIEGSALAVGFDLEQAVPGRNYLQDGGDDRLLLLEVLDEDDGTHIALLGYAPDDDPDGPLLEVYRITEGAPSDMPWRTWLFPELGESVSSWLRASNLRHPDISRTALENFVGWFEATVLENDILKQYVRELDVEIMRLNSQGAELTAELRDQKLRYEQLQLRHRLLKLESQKKAIDKEDSKLSLRALGKGFAIFLAGATLAPALGDVTTAWGTEILPYPTADAVQLRCEQTIYTIDGTITEVGPVADGD